MDDKQLEDTVDAMRTAALARKEHPLEEVSRFLLEKATAGQLKRIYGCHNPTQAAGRATYGDAFHL